MVFYIGYYDTLEYTNEKRRYVLSATNKMSYIISVLQSAGNEVTIISCSDSLSSKRCPARTCALDNNVVLQMPGSIGKGGRIRNIIDRFWIKLQVLWRMIANSKPNDTVIVYHSTTYMKVIRLLKAIKRFRLIIEVEELYSDVQSSTALRRAEDRFFRIADAYVFPSELLDSIVNINHKPSAIIYGTYKTEINRGVSFDDEKIHCVYAGTFDPRKGGVAAVEVAKYLDNKYHIHIIGFGNDDDKKSLLSMIEQTTKKTECLLTFDGLLRGEEYIRFLQKCDIGLSPQDPQAAFNETSFPSKILSYMANGLKVVSIRIPAIEGSAFANELVFYDDNQPELMADAIRRAAASDRSDSRAVVQALDEGFRSDMERLLQELKI